MNTTAEVQEQIQPIELSFSAIETFNQCPRKYYYNYILRLPKKDWPWLVFGVFVHSALEKFHKYILYFKKRNLEINYNELMKRAYLSASRFHSRKTFRDKSLELTDKQRQQAKDILKYHLDGIKKEYPDVVYVEKGFRLKIGDFVIRGFIDRVDRIGENIYEVIDYKTSSKTYDVEKNNQLGIYGYALKKLIGEHIEIKKKLDFIKLFKEKTGKYKAGEDKIVEKYILDSGNNIKKSRETLKEEAGWKPIDNDFCKFCDFKDRCYSQREIMF